MIEMKYFEVWVIDEKERRDLRTCLDNLSNFLLCGYVQNSGGFSRIRTHDLCVINALPTFNWKQVSLLGSCVPVRSNPVEST